MSFENFFHDHLAVDDDLAIVLDARHSHQRIDPGKPFVILVHIDEDVHKYVLVLKVALGKE